MARTTAMRLVELMILRQDIHNVLKYLGEFGDFQFQQDFSLSSDSKMENPDQVVFEKLQKARVDLELEDLDGYKGKVNLPEEKDLESVENICSKTEAIHQSELNAAEESKRASSEYNEALAFSNLQVSYSELESLSSPSESEKLILRNSTSSREGLDCVPLLLLLVMTDQESLPHVQKRPALP